MDNNCLALLTCLTCCTLASGQGWSKIPHGMTKVSGGLNYIWGVSKSMDIYMCPRPCTGTWKLIPGKLVQLDANDYEIWGVNANDDIFVRPIDGSGEWKHVKGKLIHVSASGNGYIWGTNRANNIFKCKKPCSGGWVRVDGGLRQIDGGQREVCGVNRNNHIFCRPVDGSGSWRRIPGQAVQVTMSGPYDMFVISTNKKMYRCRKPCIGQWIEFEQTYHPFSQCDGTVDGLFAVDSGQSVWRKDLPL